MWTTQIQMLFVAAFVMHQSVSQGFEVSIDKPSVIEGSSVVFNCEVPEELTSEVTWFHNGTKIFKELHQNKKIQLNGSLTINNVLFNDTGKYDCHLSGIFKGSASLTVFMATKISYEKDLFLVQQGQSTTLPCSVSADPRLQVNTKWTKWDLESDADNESRFSKLPNNSLFISNAFLNDSGIYTCFASTELDDTSENIQLLVLSVPSVPRIKEFKCIGNGPLITWEPNEYDHIPLHYTIQFITSFAPDEWQTYEKDVVGHQCMLPYTPWANYSYRIIAHNDIGASEPSEPTEMCEMSADYPNKNPDDVKAEGGDPTHLVISWKPMPPIEHHGPGFYYLVWWKRDCDVLWPIFQRVDDWKRSSVTVTGQSIFRFTRYHIKVEACNNVGRSIVKPIEVIGYSGEDRPTTAPTNLIITYKKDYAAAILHWTAVSKESVNGHFKGYTIHISNKFNQKEIIPDMHVKDNSTELTISELRRGVIYSVCISSKNTKYSSPLSDAIEFKISDQLPSRVQSFEAFPLGSTAFLLRWKPPLNSNEPLTGYVIYYEDVNGSEEVYGSATKYKKKKINDPNVNQTKLTGFKPSTKYQLFIVAHIKEGGGERFDIEAETKAEDVIKPDQPSFLWQMVSMKNNSLKVKVVWMPNVDQNPGTDFVVKYSVNGTQQWVSTARIVMDDFVIVDGLLPTETYEMFVESIEGNFVTESNIKMIPRYRMGIESFPESRFDPMLGITAICCSVVFASVVVFLIVRRYRNGKLTKEKEIEINNIDFCLRTFEKGNIDGFNPELTLDEQADLLPYDQKYEFPKENLQLGQQLGTGAFGVVFKATAKGIVAHEEETTVAVKTVKRITGHEVLRALALELKILVHLGRHLNVVNLLGAITKNIHQNELMIIVEYCRYGNLRDFLVNHRENFIDQLNHEEDMIDGKISVGTSDVSIDSGNDIGDSSDPIIYTITTTDLLCWSFQIARGMHYLASRKVLHGDLAARNVLLCEGNVVKICDFGLARSIYKTGDYHIKTERKLPFKWLALESIGDQVFSTYSDVWSFGIVLWEIFSLGATPYPGMSADEDLFNKLKDGYRMEKPEYATQEIYDIMLSCWQLIPNSRPLFDKIEEKITNMLDRSVCEHYIVMNEPYLKVNVNSVSSDQIDYFALMGSPDCQSPPIPQMESKTSSFDSSTQLNVKD